MSENFSTGEAPPLPLKLITGAVIALAAVVALLFLGISALSGESETLASESFGTLSDTNSISESDTSETSTTQDQPATTIDSTDTEANSDEAAFLDCSQAAAAGQSNIDESDPAFSEELDRDNDGTACESTTTTQAPTTTQASTTSTTAAPSTTTTVAPTTTTTAAPAPAITPAPASPSSATEAQWAALRQCEATGNYQAFNPAGPYMGAYQFDQRTWDGVARTSGRTELVGVQPSAAAPADQDQMARQLHSERGWQPWPACSAKLGFR